MRDCAPVAGVSSCFLQKELTFFGEEENISSRSFKLFGDFFLTVALKKTSKR
jgi:hypothetical protein